MLLSTVAPDSINTDAGGGWRWHDQSCQRFTVCVYIDQVGWVCGDPCDPCPSSFGYSAGDTVTMSAQPSLRAVQMDMALLRPGFEETEENVTNLMESRLGVRFFLNE